MNMGSPTVRTGRENLLGRRKKKNANFKQQRTKQQRGISACQVGPTERGHLKNQQIPG